MSDQVALNPDAGLPELARHVRAFLNRADAAPLLDSPSFLELLFILEKDGSLDAQYRERTVQIQADVLGRRRRIQDDMKRVVGENPALLTKFFDDEFRAEIERFTEGTLTQKLPNPQEFFDIGRKICSEFINFLSKFIIGIAKSLYKIPLPYQPDLAAWRSDVVRLLGDCYKRLLRDYFGWQELHAREFAAWWQRVRDYYEHVEQAGKHLAIFREWDRTRPGPVRDLLPGERPEDRFRDCLVAKGEMGVSEVLAHTRAELAQLCAKWMARDGHSSLSAAKRSEMAVVETGAAGRTSEAGGRRRGQALPEEVEKHYRKVLRIEKGLKLYSRCPGKTRKIIDACQEKGISITTKELKKIRTWGHKHRLI